MMTRGRIVLITDERVFATIEFNGEMGPSMYCGQQALQMAKEVYTREDLEKTAKIINQNFGYDKTLVYITKKIFADSFNKRTYFQRWFSDYLYVINRKKENHIVKDFDRKEICIEPNKIAVFHFGKLHMCLNAKKQKTVYIAHPFTSTGSMKENKEKVLKYVQMVLENGDIPLCTITMFGDLYGKVNEVIAMDACKALLKQADVVMFAGDWKNSKGCQEEYKIAKGLGKEIIYA